MEHIKRMEIELEELVAKKNGATSFLEKERNKDEGKILDYTQMFLLDRQVKDMAKYEETLRSRIEYDKEKAEKEKK